MNFSYWTPRYAWNRLAFEIYQRRNPDKPWLTPKANAMLDELLRPDRDVGLEWGSGRSTLWFARHLKHLTSIENHAEWHERVKKMLADAGATNVDYRRLDVQTGDHESPDWPYVRAIDSFADESLNFVLVDGWCRGTCAVEAVPKLAPGGVLVVDNINWYLDHPTHAPASRFGKGHLNHVWRTFEQRVKGWRTVWTSSGVTDTALWFKPPATTSVGPDP